MSSYSQILKSSSLVGGAQFVRMLIGIVSTKFAAIYIGPGGVGLIGAYQSITQLGIQLSGLGIKQSGVREVAAMVGSGDDNSVARTVLTLRRICGLTGVVGAVGLIALSLPISTLTFGGDEHRLGLILLSLVVLVTAITNGHMAVFQGLRKITDLVRVQIWGALAGALISIYLYVVLGISGIVPALLSIALCNLGAAWWYSRKIILVPVALSWRNTLSEAKGLVGLGSAFMVGGLAVSFSAYASRALIARDIGLDGVGMYQAAFAISGYVLNFVLGAMGTDFYPRLAGISDDHDQMTRLVNEQTEIGLLLATPALLATLGLAPLFIYFLYSGQFEPAVELLRWLVLGCFLQVISWPMGLVLMAKGEKYWYVFSQLAFSILHIVFIVIGLNIWGLCGASVAFFASYVLHVIGMRLITGHLVDFTWSKGSKSLMLIQVSIVFVLFAATHFLPELWSIVLGCVLSLVMSLYSLRQLLLRLGADHRFYRALNTFCGEKILKLFTSK